MSAIVVVGGGISGLTAAWELRRRGQDVVVLEGSRRAGGCIETRRESGYRFEMGAHAVQGEAPHFHELTRELGIADQVREAHPDARRRFLYSKDGLAPLPQTIFEFMKTPLFTWGQKLRAFLEQWVHAAPPEREETVAEFFGRRVGRGITMTWVDVVVSGVYGGNPNRLGISSAFPLLRAMELEHGSIFRGMRAKVRERRQGDGTQRSSPLLSLNTGLSQLVETLVSKLETSVHYESRVRTLRRRDRGGFSLDVQREDGALETLECDRMVLAVPAQRAGFLLAPLVPDVSDLLFEIDAAPMVVVHGGFLEKTLPGLPRGFGFLAPRSMRMRTLGWIFDSHLFPEAAPEGRVAMTGFVGGTLDPHVIDASDEQILHLMEGELALALSQRKLPRPELWRIVRWRDVLPQYNVGHLRRMKAVLTLLGEGLPDLAVAGNWLCGVSVESCIQRAREAVTELLSEAVPSPS